MSFHLRVTLLIFSLNLFTALAQTNCTTLQPVFVDPLAGTSTVYASTATATSAVDCNGCSLVVSTFPADLSLSTTTTDSLSITTSTSYLCAPSTSPVPTTTNSAPPFPPATPTASPLPPLNGTVSTLISELQTALIYAVLIANDDNLPKLCSVVNPSALSNITGVNGTVVQSEVCAAASIDKFYPGLGSSVVEFNQLGVGLLFTALYAAQVAGGFAGGTDLRKLCGEIEATLIDRLFIGFVPGGGTAVKDFVCGKANQTVAKPSSCKC